MKFLRSILAVGTILAAAEAASAQNPENGPPLQAQFPRPATAGRRLVMAADLRPQIELRGLDVRSQGARPTCTIFATAFLIEYMQTLGSGRVAHRHASVEYLNWAANQATGKADDGGYFADVVAGYQAWGMVPEEGWEYGERWSSAYQPTEELKQQGVAARSLTATMLRANDGTYGLSDEVVAQVVASLDAGIPVAAGFRFSTQMSTVTINGNVAIDAMVKMDTLWAHSMALVGYRRGTPAQGGGYFVVRNSGGPDNGDHGYMYVTFRYLRQHVADVIVFREAPAGMQLMVAPPEMSRVGTPLPLAPPRVVDAIGALSRRQ
jgi:hypothetical protein